MTTPTAPLEPVFFRHVKHQPHTPALEVEGLQVSYGQRVVLHDLNLRVNAGERMAVVGPNVAGKSTLFKAAAGLLEPDRGEIRVFGAPPRRHACIAYLVQRSEVDWSFPVSVADVVMMGRIREVGFFHRPKPADRAFVRGCLERVGLQDLAQRQISELSGGQQQRMFIARALAQQAELMLMDEPFTGLDLTTQEGILHLLAELSRSRVTVMVATHDLNLAAQHFDRVLLLNGRAVACGRASEVLTKASLTETFGGHAHTISTRDGLILVNDTCCSGGAPHV